MYRRYYDGYPRNAGFPNTGEIIVPERRTDATYDAPKEENSNDEVQITSCSKGFSLGSLELDDLILIGVLIFLLADSGEKDPIVLVIIGYLLLGEIF